MQLGFQQSVCFFCQILTKLESDRHTSVKNPNTELHYFFFTWNRRIPRELKDGLRHMMKLLDAFRNFCEKRLTTIVTSSS
jgi:hypothetical protein